METFVSTLHFELKYSFPNFTDHPKKKKKNIDARPSKTERMKGRMIFNMNSMQRMQEVRRLRMC